MDVKKGKTFESPRKEIEKINLEVLTELYLKRGYTPDSEIIKETREKSLWINKI